MTAAKRYYQLEEELFRLRARGDDEDAVLEQMDDAWWEMTAAERASADARPVPLFQSPQVLSANALADRDRQVGGGDATTTTIVFAFTHGEVGRAFACA
jgi:hypothetical protein